jgi:hypothetical protein
VITPKDVLEELRRSDGQITDYGRPAGPILFDPTIGPGERVEWETFSTLRDSGWVTTDDQGPIRRYRISSAGADQLREAQPQSKVRTEGA